MPAPKDWDVSITPDLARRISSLIDFLKTEEHEAAGFSIHDDYHVSAWFDDDGDLVLIFKMFGHEVERCVTFADDIDYFQQELCAAADGVEADNDYYAFWVGDGTISVSPDFRIPMTRGLAAEAVELINHLVEEHDFSLEGLLDYQMAVDDVKVSGFEAFQYARNSGEAVAFLTGYHESRHSDIPVGIYGSGKHYTPSTEEIAIITDEPVQKINLNFVITPADAHIIAGNLELHSQTLDGGPVFIDFSSGSDQNSGKSGTSAGWVTLNSGTPAHVKDIPVFGPVIDGVAQEGLVTIFFNHDDDTVDMSFRDGGGKALWTLGYDSKPVHTIAGLRKMADEVSDTNEARIFRVGGSVDSFFDITIAGDELLAANGISY